MSKKLTLSHLKSKVKEYDVKEKIQLDEETHVHIFPNFSPKRIKEMVKEMISDEERARKENIEFNVNLARWAQFNIIKFFSDLGIPSEIDKKLQMYTFLEETDYFDDIINAFPEENFNRILKELDKVNNNLNAFNEMSEEDRKKLLETLNIGDDENVILN